MKFINHFYKLPKLNIVKESPALKAADSLNVILPGISISKR